MTRNKEIKNREKRNTKEKRKKRKKLGAKLGIGYESDMAGTLTQRPLDYH